MEVTEQHQRLLVLDLLESYARERDLYVMLERVRGDDWMCVLRSGTKGLATRTVGKTAREAILDALRSQGVEIPA